MKIIMPLLLLVICIGCQTPPMESTHEVAIIGAIKKPGVYRLPDKGNLCVKDILALVGGATAAPELIRVEFVDNDGGTRSQIGMVKSDKWAVPLVELGIEIGRCKSIYFQERLRL